ncbi:MAG: hypothetical protein EOO73_20380 [Myxococcales bacterium]|nr:MAG: hypothetical protein EOO73_20380 [Myxococcales bacterium]
MSELSSEARALVSDGRSALRPTSEDRVRMASRLVTQLGAAALLATRPSYAAPKAPFASKLSSFVAALGLIGASATYSLTRPTESAAGTPGVAQAGQVQVAPPTPASAPCVDPEAAAVHQPIPAETPVPRARKESRVDGALAEEVALLSRATSRLRGGDAAGALELLEQHRRQFGGGALLEERLSARVQALCSLGRRSEAESDLVRLAASAPRSPHVTRAQRACGL